MAEISFKLHEDALNTKKFLLKIADLFLNVRACCSNITAATPYSPPLSLSGKYLFKGQVYHLKVVCELPARRLCRQKGDLRTRQYSSRQHTSCKRSSINCNSVRQLKRLAYPGMSVNDPETKIIITEGEGLPN